MNIFAYAVRGDGVSRVRTMARESRRSASMSFVSGCEIPKTRRAVRAVASSVDTASRRSSSVAPSSA